MQPESATYCPPKIVLPVPGDVGSYRYFCSNRPRAFERRAGYPQSAMLPVARTIRPVCPAQCLERRALQRALWVGQYGDLEALCERTPGPRAAAVQNSSDMISMPVVYPPAKSQPSPALMAEQGDSSR